MIVLMPSDHRLTSREAIHPRELVGEIFIGGANKAAVLQAVTEDYLRRSGLDIKPDHGVDNMAMAMSLVSSNRGLALMPAYAKNSSCRGPWSAARWRRRSANDRCGRGLQQGKHLADSEAVPFKSERAGPEGNKFGPLQAWNKLSA